MAAGRALAAGLRPSRRPGVSERGQARRILWRLRGAAEDAAMATVTEIAPDTYRICTYVPEARLGFCQFLVRDEEPLLFHSGLRAIFPGLREAVATLMDPRELRWVGLSHFEADECGALGLWQQEAPRATGLCSLVAKMVSVDDTFPARPARALADGETFSTGRHSFQFLQTPHVPHGWDAGLLFDETTGTLFCSDLFHQNGDVEPATREDVVGRYRRTVTSYQKGPFAQYMPLTAHTDPALARLEALRPGVLATMHGSTYVGDGARAIADLRAVLREDADRL